MELSLRKRRAEGDGPIVVVTLDFEHFVRWCEESGYDPADRRSRGTYMQADERQSVAETALAAGPQRAMLVWERTQVQALLRRGFKRR